MIQYPPTPQPRPQAMINLTDVLTAGPLGLTHQDEVRLVRGQHEDGDVVVGQRGDDGLGDFGDSDGLRTGSVAAARHHVEGQPRGVRDADQVRLRQL